jgi:predicted dinucleotide-utilizing enzyme
MTSDGDGSIANDGFCSKARWRSKATLVGSKRSVEERKNQNARTFEGSSSDARMNPAAAIRVSAAMSVAWKFERVLQ